MGNKLQESFEEPNPEAHERPSDGVEQPSRKTRSLNKKSEIRANHSVHDRLQAESNFTFDLRPRTDDEDVREFKIDLYLHLPSSMGINSSNFNASQFFRHRTSYYRVRAPQYQLLRTIEPAEFRLETADRYFDEHLSSIDRRRLSKKVVQEVRLFGNFLHTELKKIRTKLTHRKRISNPSRRAHLADSLTHRTELLWAFRKRYMGPIRKERYLLDDEVIRAFSLTDEYLSYRLELVLLQARETMEERLDELNQLLERECQYRKSNELLVLSSEEKDPVLFEAFTYRLGLLKKYMGEALFLNLKSVKKDRLYKNYAAAVGAGLAATVAGLAEQQRVQYLTGNDSGLRLAFLIGVAVVAYIFKDRVKDLSKEYFNSRLKERLPDESYRLSHTSYTSKGRKKVRRLGEVSEYFRFLKDVPADVAYLRTLGQARASDPKRRENVMHMGRRFSFELRSPKHRKLFPLLKNVHRIDISPFLSKLDNPTVPISYFDSDGSAMTAQAPKVYHINIVIRYEVKFGEGDASRRVDYERYRLVVNKNGIVRMEKVVDMGRLGYEVAAS